MFETYYIEFAVTILFLVTIGFVLYNRPRNIYRNMIGKSYNTK